MKPPTWDELLDQMQHELLHDGPRAESCRAQQLAFGPVLVHAFCLRLRHLPTWGREPPVVQCVQLARAGFGSLPEPPACDPIGLRTLAARQARALGWGQRSALDRLLVRLGSAPPAPEIAAPPRLTRIYPRIGWKTHERLAG